MSAVYNFVFNLCVSMKSFLFIIIIIIAKDIKCGLVRDVEENLLQQIKCGLVYDIKENFLQDIKCCLVLDIKENLLPDIKGGLVHDIKDNLLQDIKGGLVHDIEEKCRLSSWHWGEMYKLSTMTVNRHHDYQTKWAKEAG